VRLLLAKARREQYGRSSERGARLIEQLELRLADLQVCQQVPPGARSGVAGLDRPKSAPESLRATRDVALRSDRRGREARGSYLKVTEACLARLWPPPRP
jgi:hypothetical protein